MYNRYIPEDGTYTWTSSGSPPPPDPEQGSGPKFSDFWKGKDGLPLLSLGKDGLSGLLKALHLEKLDSGDILLMLIVLYLLVEGDDMELVIALGLVLLMGFGES